MDLAFIQSPEFPNWLARQEGETLAWLTERIALREAPIWFEMILAGYGHPQEPRVTPLLRSLISTCALRRFPGEAELQRLSAYSARVAKVYLDSGGAFWFAGSVLDYQTEGDFNHDKAALSACRDGPYGGNWCMEEVHQDVLSVASGGDLGGQPLWRAGPNKAAAQWAAVAADWRTPDSPFAFWALWYQDALDGREPNKELLRDAALIPSDVWEAGPAAVAEAIATIEDRYRLRGEVAALKEQLQELLAASNTAFASPHERSHNHPPELIEAEAETRRDVADLVVTLEAAERELSKSAPAPSILRRVGTTIFNVTKRIALYCGGLADIAVKKAAEEVGTTGARWAIGLASLSLASQIEPLRALAKALLEFAQRLAGM